MSYISLTEASEIYSCADALTIIQYPVQHDGFRKFCISLREFETMLGASTTDDYWQPFLRFMRRYRFDLSAATLPFNFNFVDFQGGALLNNLASHLKNCESVYPGLDGSARTLLDGVGDLIRSDDNPLLWQIKDLQKAGDSCTAAVVVKEHRLIPPVETILGKDPALSDFQVVSPLQLRGEGCYSRLVLIGPARWFPVSVFTSPRAGEIHNVKYAWIADSLSISPVLPGARSTNITEVQVWRSPAAKADAKGGLPETSGVVLDAEEFLELVDWERIKSRTAYFEQGSRSLEEIVETELVEARLFLLEGDAAVALDSSEGAGATIIDLAQDSRTRVQRIPVSNIETGMFILLRTEGSGEYIVELADRILGDEASRARVAQRYWKSLLRRAVRSLAIGQVAADLRKLGSTLANDVNIRNWMSYRSIKTDHYADFHAIMQHIRLGHQADEYWQIMTLIDHAHRRAGQLIRRRLLRQVLGTDVRDLEKLGKMDFALPEGGSLTAFRVRDIYGETVLASESHIGRVFFLDGG